MLKKGQKLYQIDQQQYRGAYEQAVAQLNASEANLEKVQQDADRYEELGKQDAVAQQTVQHALADLADGKKTGRCCKANVSALEVNLRYSTIYAPLIRNHWNFAGKTGSFGFPRYNIVEYHFIG